MKLKILLRRIMPSREWIQGVGVLRAALGDILHDPRIFHLTRRSAAGGVSAGVFFAFIPVPGQTLLAALSALLFRVNLPLAVLFTFITNPVTMAPLLYLSYRLGAGLLGTPYERIGFEISAAWFGGTFLRIWPSVFTGGLLIGIVSGAAAYVLINLLWRLAVARKWARRKKVRSEE